MKVLSESEALHHDDEDSHKRTTSNLRACALTVKYAKNKAQRILRDIEEHPEEQQVVEKPSQVPFLASASLLLNTAPRCRLNLDNAVVVLLNSSFSSVKDAKT